MKQVHITPSGDPALCRAQQGKCPFGQHFAEVGEARAAVEAAASFTPSELTSLETSLSYDGLDTVIALNESDLTLSLGGTVLPWLDKVQEPAVVSGHSSELAELVRFFSDEEDAIAEGFQVYGVVEHQPVGALVGTHTANTLQARGTTYVVDFAFAEIDPNRAWPYVGSEEAWQQEVDRASVLGAPEKLPDPIDPRSLTLSTVPPGAFNPLLERATLEGEQVARNGTLYRFLSVDQVRVASIRYAVEEDGKPHIHSIETRQEYRQQGYMKKLLQELAQEYSVERVYSSGKMTHDGYNFTRHLTALREEDSHRVEFPDFGQEGRKTFSFVHDWVAGTLS